MTRSLAEKPKLRIALLLDSFDQPLWARGIVRDIQSSGIAEVALIVRQAGGPETGWFRAVGKAFSKRSIFLWKLYEWADALAFRPKQDPFERASISPLVGDAPVLIVKPEHRGVGQYFAPEDVARVRGHGIDVALRLGFGILKGEALQVARHGVWSFHHGDNRVNRGGPAGAWEVLLDEPTTGSILQVLTERLDDGKVLYRSWSPTCRYSVARNRANLFWKTSHFVLRKLKDLRDGGPGTLEEAFPPAYRPYSRPLYRSPTNGQMVRLLPKILFRILRKALQKLFLADGWTIGYCLAASPGPAETFHRFKLLTPPRDRWWADPFPVEREGRYFLFVEEYLVEKKKGHISVMEMDGRGEWGSPVKVLDRPYHLSYPFLFEHQGRLYMVPETSGRRTVELYRCDSFPLGWTLDRILLEGVDASDVTLYQNGGLWWMFANVKPEGCRSSDELSVFHADSPFGPWRPHARNPVKSDARCSRPAGGLFEWKGGLYRPAQDCVPEYGTAVSIQRVLRLTPEEFEESEVSRVEPRWGPGMSRTHTLNHAGRLTVVDVFFRRLRRPF